MPQGPPRADLDQFLNVLAKKAYWTYPDIDSLKGSKYKGLSELRWQSGRVQHRLIGYAEEATVYVLLIGCTHKQRRYDPTDALDTAADRKKKIKSGEATTCEYQLITGR
jgi:hypothetical protein